MRFQDLGFVLLAALIIAIVVTCWPDCAPEAHAQADATEVASEDPEAPVESVVESVDEHEYIPPPVDEDNALEGTWIWMPLPALLLALVVALMVMVLRRRAKGKGLVRAKPGDKKSCPCCKGSTDPREFYPMPRIALPRRTFHLGPYQLLLPEPDESQSIEVCPTCYELGMIYARMKHEEFMTIRAKDREREFKERVEAQKGMGEAIKKMKNGEG